MNLRQFRQSIGHLKTRLFRLAPAEQQYYPQDIEQLVAAIIEYGRMRQECGSHSVFLARCRRSGDAFARDYPHSRQGAGGAEGSGSR